MLHDRFARSIAGATAAVAVVLLTAQPGFAAGDPPKPTAPKCSEHKKGTPGWKRCMGQYKDDESLYELGYTLAKSSDHAEALSVLRSVARQSDPRVQTMIGFSLRKLGRVDEAMAYYAAALSADPSQTNTRQYLGEAYLQKNDVARANEQLAAIATRRGTQCEDYVALAAAIAAHDRRG